MSSFVNGKSIYSKSSWSSLYMDHIHNIPESHKSLEQLIITIFASTEVPSLNFDALEKILEQIKNRYNTNPYHNFEHACHVVLNCGYILYSLGAVISPLSKISLLYAALIHDVDHLGVPNISLIRKSHDLAVLYHDQSVAEMHSLAIGLGLLSEPGLDIFLDLSPADRFQFRQNVIELVLCTDIADAYRRKRTFARLDELSTGPDGALDISSDAGRIVLLSLALRAADIGSSFQSFSTSKIWARRYYLETNGWLVSEGKEFFSHELFFKDQISHMDNYVGYIVERLVQTRCLEELFVATLQENFSANKRGWLEEGDGLLDVWEVEFKAVHGLT